MTQIDQKVIEGALGYKEYRELTEQLFAAGKTTGSIQNEAMLEYTRLNIARMKRLDKRATLKPEATADLDKVSTPIIWLTLTEAWCGDAAQIIPVMEKMALTYDNIELKLILRDEHLDIMDAFLTNGGRSIPKVIILKKDTLKVMGCWGPRPSEAQQMVMEARKQAQKIQDKAERKAFWNKRKAETQLWYAKDKTNSTQSELTKATLKALAPLELSN